MISCRVNPERGTGQWDIHSPFTWLAVFDVLLTALDNQPVTDNQFMLRRPDASLYPARPICYADDLQSFASSLPSLQDTLVSVCAMVFNLWIAVHKLRAFHYCGLSAPPEDPEVLVIHAAGWIPHTALIRIQSLCIIVCREVESDGLIGFPSRPSPSIERTPVLSI